MADSVSATAISPPAEPRLARRLFANYLAQLANQGLRVVEQLVLVPLYLSAWGVDLYKDWILVFAIASFLGSCNLGTENYFGNLFLKDVARGDRAAFRHHLRVALFCTALIAFAMLFLFYAALAGIDFRELLQLTVLDRRSGSLILVIMTLPVAVLISQQALHTIYRAFGDFTWGEFIYGIFNASQIGSVVLALALGAGPWTVAFAYLVVPVAFSFGLLIDVYRRYPDISLGLARPSREELRDLVPQSALYFTFPVSLALIQNGTLLVFGFLHASAIGIVTYNTYRIFTGLTQQAANQFAVGGGIEMARQHARGEYAECQHLYTNIGRISAILAGVLAGISIPLSGPFIQIWTKGAVMPDPFLLGAFLLGVVAAAPGQASMMLLKFSNYPKPLAAGWMGPALGGLVLAAVFYPFFGVAGAALAFSLCQFLAVGLFLPIAVERIWGFSALRHLAYSHSAGLVAFAVSYGLGRLVFQIEIGGIAGLILKGSIWGLIILPPTLLLVIPPEKRRRILSRPRRFLRSFMPLSR